MKLADKERRVLEQFAGKRIGEQGGAAFMQSLESLHGNGLIYKRWYGNFPPKWEYAITDAGRRALEGENG